ncbi:MAG: V-type ATP synthase subunit E [Christensenellaceae bacterium]|jgi:vacuolar-type H+-ATPase subunit E/Vma4|nr:V-type ATP synthase subunit E [Christensenellaceae bacterium]
MANDLNNGEKLLSCILDSARVEADSMIADAKAQAAVVAERAETEVRRIEDDAAKRAKRAHADILERSRTNAELDSRKYALAQKHVVVDAAFDEALKQLGGESGPARDALLNRLLQENSEGGERVEPAQADAARIEPLLAAVNAALLQKGKAALTLGQPRPGICGGFFLIAEGYEINCSFEAILRDLRGAETAGVAQILFQ